MNGFVPTGRFVVYTLTCMQTNGVVSDSKQADARYCIYKAKRYIYIYMFVQMKQDKLLEMVHVFAVSTITMHNPRSRSGVVGNVKSALGRLI